MSQSPEFSFETLMKHVEKRIYSRNWKHSDIDDLVQEARIHAWEDYISGDYTELKDIVRRAANRVRNLRTDSTRTGAFGKPRANNGDFRKTDAGEAARQKIRMYRDEYSKLHGGMPTMTQIAGGIGMSVASVSRYMKTLDAYHDQTISEVVSMPEWVGEGYINPPDNLDFGVFETRTVNRMVIKDYLDRCPENEKLALYFRFWEDKTTKEVASNVFAIMDAKTEQARADLRQKAYSLREICGLSLREAAETLGVGKDTVAKLVDEYLDPPKVSRTSNGYFEAKGSELVSKGLDRLRILMEADTDR